MSQQQHNIKNPYILHLVNYMFQYKHCLAVGCMSKNRIVQFSIRLSSHPFSCEVSAAARVGCKSDLRLLPHTPPLTHTPTLTHMQRIITVQRLCTWWQSNLGVLLIYGDRFENEEIERGTSSLAQTPVTWKWWRKITYICRLLYRPPMQPSEYSPHNRRESYTVVG